MKSQSKMRVALVAIVLMLVLFELPVIGQDDGELLVISGELTINDSGDLFVNGYVIAPSSAFVPVTLHEGDTVIVSGELLEDGMTIQAVSVELFESGDEDGDGLILDPAGASDDADDGNGRGRGNQSNNDDDDDDDDGNGRGNQGRGNQGNNNDDDDGNGRGNQGRGNQGNNNDDDDDGNGRGNQGNSDNANNGQGSENSNRAEAIRGQSEEDHGRGDSNRGKSCDADSDFENPAAQRIADEFEGANYDSVLAAFCEGAGMGEVLLAMRLAEIGGGNSGDFLQARAGGQGWGEIMNNAGVSPSEAASGRRNENAQNGNRGNNGNNGNNGNG